MNRSLFRQPSTFNISYSRGLVPESVGARALPNAAASVPQEGARVAEAARVDHAPRIDGTLNDPLASVNELGPYHPAKPHRRPPEQARSKTPS